MICVGITSALPALRGFLAANLAILTAMSGRRCAVSADTAAQPHVLTAARIAADILDWNTPVAAAEVVLQCVEVEQWDSHAFDGIVVCGSAAELQQMFHVEHPVRTAFVLTCTSLDEFERTIRHCEAEGHPQLLPYGLTDWSEACQVPVVTDPTGPLARAVVELYQELLPHE